VSIGFLEDVGFLPLWVGERSSPAVVLRWKRRSHSLKRDLVAMFFSDVVRPAFCWGIWQNLAFQRGVLVV